MEESEAAVAILHAQSPEETVLLIRRAERSGDPWSGHWSFPGGRRDPEDHDLLDTAIRELWEECGIRLSRERREATLRPTFAGRRAGLRMNVQPYLFRVPAPLPVQLDSREAVVAYWIPLRILQDIAMHRLQQVPGGPAETYFPAIELDGAPLWGFTYRVLCEWMGLAPGPDSAANISMEQANALLAFLQSSHLTIVQNWTAGSQGKNVAIVSGPVPVNAVIAHFGLPRAQAPALHFVEVRDKRIHLIGPDGADYVVLTEN